MDGGGTSPLHTWMPLGGEDPSFFELFMVDKLQRAIMPALEHSLQVLANHAAADEDEEQSPDLGLGGVQQQQRRRWLGLALLRHPGVSSFESFDYASR